MQTPNLTTALLCCLIAFKMFGQQPKGNYTLKANLTGFRDSTKFFFVNLDSTQDNDSAYLQKGKLVFKGHVSEPVNFRLYPEQSNLEFNFWLENRSITITGDKSNFSDLRVTGSPLNKIFFDVEHEHSKLDKLRDSLFQKGFYESNEVKQKAIWDTIADIDKEVTKIRLHTIVTFKPSLVTMKELYYLRNDLTDDSLKMLFDKFPLSLQRTKYGDVIIKYLSTGNLREGLPAPDISGSNLINKQVSLSDFRGKVVLLDFWASWCVPCRAANKELAILYQKYKNSGFEIVSFSTDTDFGHWKEASDKESISWTNISDLKALYSKQAAAYRVRAIPKLFLIDKNGKIVQILTGYGDNTGAALEKRIIELTK